MHNKNAAKWRHFCYASFEKYESKDSARNETMPIFRDGFVAVWGMVINMKGIGHLKV